VLRFERIEIFESTHPVECLYCEKRFRCDDPKNEEEINGALKEIDEGLKRLKKVADLNARTRLQKIGEELKERNRKFGNAIPSVLLAIGKKAGASLK